MMKRQSGIPILKEHREISEKFLCLEIFIIRIKNNKVSQSKLLPRIPMNHELVTDGEKWEAVTTSASARAYVSCCKGPGR